MGQKVNGKSAGMKSKNAVSNTKARPTQANGKAKAGAGVDLKATLRDAGLRSTAPRLAVLEYLRRAAKPASHGELHERLASSGYDRATLYRNLMDLAEVGLVTRTDLGDHVWRFELRREGGEHADDHPHFVCTDCGGVACLPNASVKITGGKGAPRAVDKRNVKVQLSGLCDGCA